MRNQQADLFETQISLLYTIGRPPVELLPYQRMQWIQSIYMALTENWMVSQKTDIPGVYKQRQNHLQVENPELKTGEASEFTQRKCNISLLCSCSFSGHQIYGCCFLMLHISSNLQEFVLLGFCLFICRGKAFLKIIFLIGRGGKLQL